MSNDTRPYALTNDDPLAERHHRLLAEMFDSISFERMASALPLVGSTVLCVGAGNANFARLLAKHVGRNGAVLATDISPIPAKDAAHPQLQIDTLDLNNPEDQRLAVGADWDVIHARLVLGHLPARLEIMQRLARALRPGGHLVIQEWDARDFERTVVAAPSEADRALWITYQRSAGEVFTDNGTDQSWHRKVNRAMRQYGLDKVQTWIDGQYWEGRSIGAQFITGVIQQLWHDLLAKGLGEEDLIQLMDLLEDPGFVLTGYPLHTSIGQRPPDVDGGRTALDFLAPVLPLPITP